MAIIGLVVHHERPLAWDTSADIVDWLLQRGHEVRSPGVDAGLIGRSAVAVPDDDLVVGLDLLIGVGGDGTILRAVELASTVDVPVLGVNAGQLGYLSSVEPSGVRMALKRFLDGSHDIDYRMRLAVSVRQPGGAAEEVGTALNEMVLERLDLGHTVRLEVSFDGRPFTSYVADGLIVATPTGSTAYAFSVRGPIIAPSHKALLLAPVSPHMLFDRCVVLDHTTVVSLVVAGHRSARLSLDGRPGGVLEDGASVECTASRSPARLIGFGQTSFHDILRARFSLPDR